MTYAVLTMETPIEDCELSVRTTNVCKTHGIKTLAEAKEKLPMLKAHAKGYGRKSENELLELIHIAERGQPGLFEDPEYMWQTTRHRIATAQALMHDVQVRLMHLALNGRPVPRQEKRQIAMKLRDAADQIEQLPSIGD